MNDYDTMKSQTVEHFNRVYDNFTKLFGTDDFYIAGGAIRDFVQSFGEPKDYDIFVTNGDTYIDICRKLEQEGYNLELEREHSKVFEKDGDCSFDIIKVDVGFDELVMDNFDLTCCTAQFGPTGFDHHPNFFKDVQEQVININNLKLPYYTYKRIAKHIMKGYTVTPEVLTKVMDFAVSEMEGEIVANSEAPSSNDPNSEKSSM